MKQKLVTMLELQDSMNTKVSDDWRAQNYEWYRAIWVECAELMDHYGWKWWKQQTPDIEQVVLELIDIWHFGLSIELMSGDSYDQIAERMLESLDLAESARGDLKLDVESFAAATLKTKLFDVKAFCALLVDVDLSFDDLYSSYVGKNVLNFFRQDNGYKEGTYMKVWGGQEDNEHLVEAIKALDANHRDFKELLYKELTRRYEQYSSS